MNSEEKFKSVKKVLWLILFANFAVAGAKVLLGTMINSASMLADGFHSLSDGTSNIVGLIGIGFAAKPTDNDHPYGHRKFEALTGLFIVAMLAFLGGKILLEAVGKIANPTMPEVTIWSLIVMLITLCINIFVATYEFRVGKKLNSTILMSDATHTKSDIYVTIGVLGTLIAIKLGAPAVVDPIVSIVVAGFIFKAAYEVFCGARDILVDASAIDPKKVTDIAMTVDGVKGVHKIRSRGTGDAVFVDMHVLADSKITLEEAHHLVHKVEEEIQNKVNHGIEVTIHIEPDNDVEENEGNV